ncbi:MAG: hypothetical protein AAF378_08135 [Cyanobacteria bacterium P01_A01_bin.84]
MLSRIKNSLAFRSGSIYKKILDTLPLPKVVAKPELPLTFLALSGANHLSFLQQSLYSLYQAWSSLPKLQVVSDGTISVSELEQALKWWPGEKTIHLPEYFIEYHRSLGRESLGKYASNNVMGLKLAAVIKAGSEGATLYCDTDILWFRNLPNLTSESGSNSKVTLKMSEDFQPAYDHQLAESKLKHLYTPPFFCAGLAFIDGKLLEELNLEDLLIAASVKANHFTEQTILAESNYRLGGAFWSREKIACFVEDQYSLTPSYLQEKWIARHYVGPVRHIYWRDALAIRLGFKQKQLEEVINSNV